MDEQLLTRLREMKRRYEPEGFIILGAFGSRARGDNRPDSDLDILYRLDQRFFEVHTGWAVEGRLVDIQEELRAFFGFRIDLADSDALRPAAKDLILPEAVRALRGRLD